MLKVAAFLLYFITACCTASQFPSNALQVEYKRSVEQRDINRFSLDFDSVYQIPAATYQYLDAIFTSFYHKLTLTAPITDSTFTDNLHYELFSVPLIAPSEQGMQLEMYANFSDPSTQYLSNLSRDHALYDYIGSLERFDLYNSKLSIGVGMSFNSGQSSKIKFIISNGKMPGYGGSTALLGFETRF
ncbi:MAG: hypothetical protein ACJAS1_002532 [Oleiphilaceae bacterium]|jgi:hypothetical protein